MKKLRKIFFPLKINNDLPSVMRVKDRFLVTCQIPEAEGNHLTHLVVLPEELSGRYFFNREDQLAIISEFQMTFEWED